MKVSTSIMAQLFQEFGNYDLALQAYNIGSTAVQDGQRNWAYSDAVDHTHNNSKVSTTLSMEAEAVLEACTQFSLAIRSTLLGSNLAYPGGPWLRLMESTILTAYTLGNS